MGITVFWCVNPCSLVDVYLRFRASAISSFSTKESTLKMEAVYSSETMERSIRLHTITSRREYATTDCEELYHVGYNTV
jgi:hypothetical protein